MWFSFGKFVHLHNAQHFFDSPGNSVFRHAVLLQAEGNILFHCHVRKQCIRLKHHVDRTIIRLQIIDDLAVKLDFSLAERYLAAVRSGLAIVVTTAAYPDRRFEGTVISVDSRVDPMTRSFLVRAEMPNADHALRAGMLMTVKLLQPAREVLGVPEIAVEQVGTGAFVYRVQEGNKVSRIKVELGARQQGKVEILSGIAAGDRIVIDGTVKLRDGSLISDATPKPAPSP